MKTLMEIAMEVGATAELKREAYGDSIGTSAAALTLLFPAGIPLERYDEVLLIARCWDKLQRIATGAAGQAECPWLDLAGYGLCGVAQAERTQETKAKWQDSVSGQGAPRASKATPASAEPTTRTPTTPSASEPSALPPSPPPASLLPQPMDAIVTLAQVNVCRSVVDRVVACNDNHCCGRAAGNARHTLRKDVYNYGVLAGYRMLLFCSAKCAREFVDGCAR